MARGRGATAREGRASVERTPPSKGARLLLFLAAVEHVGPSVGCHKKSDLFSSLSPMKLLCFLLPGADGGDGAAGGAADERWSRSDNAVLQALSPPPSRRRASAVRTQQRPTLSRGGKNHLKGKEAARACPTCWAPQNGWVSASMPTARRDNKAQEA